MTYGEFIGLRVFGLLLAIPFLFLEDRLLSKLFPNETPRLHGAKYGLASWIFRIVVIAAVIFAVEGTKHLLP